MANVVRLNNGGVIQVRTGVLQGVGPIGPRGLQGNPGPTGPQGPQGETGPPGAITQYLTSARVSSDQGVGSDTDTLVSFGNVIHDDLNVLPSSTNITLTGGLDYLLTAWVQFAVGADTSGDGARALWFQSNLGGILARSQSNAVVDDSTFVEVVWPHRAADNEIVNVVARSGDDVQVTIKSGGLSIVRVGSGPRGPMGPTGLTGPVGPAGPRGIQGPQGNAGGSYATYGDIKP